MWIKIIMFISILGSAAAIFVAEKQIKPKILDLKADLAEEEQKLVTEKAEHKKTTDDRNTIRDERDDLRAQKDQLTRNLQDEKALRQQAEAESKRAKQSEQRAITEAENVKDMNKQFWDLKSKFNLTPAKIASEHKELPKVKTELSTIKSENGILMSQFTQLKDKYDQVINPNRRVIQPVGIRGKVVAVDPKWKFVILNIGSNHGVRGDGELTVTRNGRYIARIKVSTVETVHSIANVIDDFDADEEGIEEGDEVVAPNYIR